MAILDNSLLIGTFGLFLFLFGLYRNRLSSKYEKTALKAIGEVEDIVKEGKYYYPIVSFNMPDSKTVAYKANTGSYPSVYNKRDKVSVMYFAENPKDFIINNKLSRSIELVLMLIGLILLIWALYHILLN